MVAVLTSIALASLAGLVAVWVVYPLAIAALAAVRRGAAITDACAPAVTVVLATRDDAAAVRARVDDCLAADYDPSRLDVVVALDRAGGVRAEALGPDAARWRGRVSVVPGDEPGGKAATLNAGVRAARGEVLVFTDTHQRFHPAAVGRLVAAFGDARVGAASGALEIPRGTGGRALVEWYWRYERWLRRCEARVHSSVGVSGSVCALRQSLWAPLPTGLILDDLYAPMRVVLRGRRVTFVESARATDTRPAEPGREYRRKVRTLTGVVQLCAWLPAVLVPVRNPIWMQFLFHKVLRLLTPYWMLALTVWAAVLGARWLQGHAALALVLAALAAAAVYAARSAVVRVVREGLLLQAAIVVATVNGLRGRWDVWR